jgi:hypothetical protein
MPGIENNIGFHNRNNDVMAVHWVEGLQGDNRGSCLDCDDDVYGLLQAEGNKSVSRWKWHCHPAF